MQVSNAGIITFQQEYDFTVAIEDSAIPLITPLRLTSHPGSTLYVRVAEDEPTLELVRESIVRGSMEISDFMPSLAVVVTWHNDELEKV